MPTVNKVKIGNTEYYLQDTSSGYTSFSWQDNENVENGDPIGTMTFNGITYTIYAPIASTNTTLDVNQSGTSLIITHNAT